jgi:uncharacterized protein (TIGR03435 family)
MTITQLAALSVAAAVALAGPTRGQSPGFEVASIKPNRSGAGISTYSVRPGGRFIATNTTLKELILVTYQVLGFQLEGGPGWADSERYDINAKAEGELPPLPPSLPSDDTPPVFLMVRSLLADRFGLVIREETREMSRYALVVSRAGRLGPNLTASTLDCAAMRAARSGAARESGQRLVPPPPPPPPARGERPPCVAASMRGYHAASGVELSSLVRSLSRVLERAVVDETGLKGPFDWSLDYAPDGVAPARADGAAAPMPDDKPSLPAALQEQLGLKLETRRGPLRMLVIERVERPTPD